MNRLTALIALIAYVVGGWFIPATHHHGDGASIGRACSTAQPAGHQCPHDHGGHAAATDISACDVEPESCSPADEGASVYRSGDGSESGCGGICAICSARSLAKTRPAGNTLVTAWLQPSGLLVPLEQSLAVSATPQTVRSRGPPMIG